MQMHRPQHRRRDCCLPIWEILPVIMPRAFALSAPVSLSHFIILIFSVALLFNPFLFKPRITYIQVVQTMFPLLIACLNYKLRRLFLKIHLATGLIKFLQPFFPFLLPVLPFLRGVWIIHAKSPARLIHATIISLRFHLHYRFSVYFRRGRLIFNPRNNSTALSLGFQK